MIFAESVGNMVCETQKIWFVTYTEKMMTTNIIGNFVADNIVFRVEVLAHHPEELTLEIKRKLDIFNI